MVAEDGSNMDSGFMMLAMFFLGGTLVLAVVLAFVVKNSRGGTIVSVSGRSERNPLVLSTETPGRCQVGDSDQAMSTTAHNGKSANKCNT